MKFLLEFVGYPGSGKTYYSKKIKKKLSSEKISLIKMDKYFFNYYSKGLINKFIFSKYYNYKINNKFKSKYIFKKYHDYLNNKLNINIRKYKLKKVLSNFHSLLELTTLNDDAKRRSLDNLKIDLCAYFLKNTKEINYLYSDEGVIQKVYLPYSSDLKFSLIEKKIKKYLKSIPLPNIIFMVDQIFEKSIINANKRNKGFNYKFEKILFTKKIFIKINLMIKKLLKKNTLIIIVKNEKSLLKSLDILKNINR